MAESKTLYIIYNANGSVFGKLSYGYRKLTSDKQGDAPCAACDLTHGGLSLSETPAWQEAKKKIQDSLGLQVVQLHLDERTPEIRTYMKENNVLSPVAILSKSSDEFEVVMDKAALNGCKGDANAFVEKLQSNKAMER